jgi:hypothetical protein
MAPPSRGASPFLNAVWILAETEGRRRRPVEILGERDAESPGPLQEIHFRAAQTVLPPLMPDPLTVPGSGSVRGRDRSLIELFTIVHRPDGGHGVTA